MPWQLNSGAAASRRQSSLQRQPAATGGLTAAQGKKRVRRGAQGKGEVLPERQRGREVGGARASGALQEVWRELGLQPSMALH